MLAKSISGAAAAVQPAYIEDVFSTYLYTGNNSTQTITNGIDLSGKGGLVWIKRRDAAINNVLFSTANPSDTLISNLDQGSAGTPSSYAFSGYGSSGFDLSGTFTGVNLSGGIYASWTFREQAKFFDVVTYTGNGANRTIAHNLGSVPGCIIVKRTDATSAWQVYHRSLANTEYLVLNDTAAKATGTTRWNSTTPTSTVFSLGTDTTVNANGGTYVAYLFAHDAGGFGLTGTDNVISCGAFTTTGNEATINLGYEPQWVLIKSSSADDGFGWLLLDNMRGWYNNTGGADNRLLANLSISEQSNVDLGNPTATGFYTGTNLGTNTTYIYIAIRRGPMKVPTSGTSVFTPVATSTNMSAGNTFNFGFPSDLFYGRGRSAGNGNSLTPRLTTKTSFTESTSAELSTQYFGFSSSQNIVNVVSTFDNDVDSYIYWGFRRAPGFFDVVAYTGTGANRTVNHNLAAVPEMMIVKARSAAAASYWAVYTAATGNTNEMRLNTTNAAYGVTSWNNTTPTNSVFTVSGDAVVNQSSQTYIAYLFATCPGVSKVGSYTGTGTTKQIDCGFTGGARFVLIKRTDSTGDWYVWDSARGIVAGDDPYLLLNSSAAEVTNTDYVDTYSAGFEISSTAPAAINANGGTFIFLAIA